MTTTHVSLPAIENAIRDVCSDLDEKNHQSPTWSRMNEDDLWRELVACVLGSRVRFEAAHAAVERMGEMELLTDRRRSKRFDQYEEDISMEENTERRRKGLLADIFVSSSNAVTRSGYLVNVDGTGNRVAAQAFGPKKVLLIVGKNKIVPNVEAGFRRIEEVVAPKNVERVNKKAFSLKKEQKYTVQNIQSVFVVIKKTDNKNRISLILVDEELGF